MGRGGTAQNVVAAVENDENAAGVNKRRTIERGVFKELVRMLDPGKKPFSPERGTSQVVMFVGLQGAGKTTSVAKCVLAPCPPPPAPPARSGATPDGLPSLWGLPDLDVDGQTNGFVDVDICSTPSLRRVLAPAGLFRSVARSALCVGRLAHTHSKTVDCCSWAHDRFALYYKRKNFKVAMVCADTFRAGAYDQLKQNATKVKVPYYGTYTESDPAKIAADGVDLFRSQKMDIIIVDTSGRHKQEAALLEEMAQVRQSAKCQIPAVVVLRSGRETCHLRLFRRGKTREEDLS